MLLCVLGAKYFQVRLGRQESRNANHARLPNHTRGVAGPERPVLDPHQRRVRSNDSRTGLQRRWVVLAGFRGFEARAARLASDIGALERADAAELRKQGVRGLDVRPDVRCEGVV